MPANTRHPLRRGHRFPVVWLALALFAPTLPAQGSPACTGVECRHDAVHQLAPAASLARARLYEGATRWGDLLRLGDLGLGALSPLEGEVIVVDGVAYHADVDGRLRVLPADATTSFAQLKRFVPDRRLQLPPVASLGALRQALDAQLASPNLFQVVRIDGMFERIRLRSVPRQQPPYPPLREVVAQQRVVAHERMAGTLVGFRFPAYLGGVNAEGWHFHFVDAARRHGGHVLDLQAGALTAALDSSRSLNLMLPADAAFDTADFSNDDGPAAGGFESAIRPQAKATAAPVPSDSP